MDRFLCQLITARTRCLQFFKDSGLFRTPSSMNDNIVSNIKLTNIFAKGSIIDICQGSEYTLEYVQDVFEENKFLITWVFLLYALIFLDENFVQMRSGNGDINLNHLKMKVILIYVMFPEVIVF